MAGFPVVLDSVLAAAPLHTGALTGLSGLAFVGAVLYLRRRRRAHL